MITPLPLFYFKPTICWIDDDKIFLDAMRAGFNKHYHCRMFNNINEGVQFISAHQPLSSNISFRREISECDEYGANNHYPVDINIPAIMNLGEMPHRSEEVALLVIDYHMPNTNGLEICRQLQSHPCKKILLTGEASAEKAVEAFNQGLIDKFLKKDNSLADLLQQYVGECIKNYFNDCTADLVSHMEASRPSLLSDYVFAEFFNRWCTENNIAEYYLINRQGSFLVRDSKGKSAYFVVMSEKEKAEFLKMNDELVDVAGDLLSDLANGVKIPFFGVDKESWHVDAKDWAPYFQPCQVIEGRERYYWAVVG